MKRGLLKITVLGAFTALLLQSCTDYTEEIKGKTSGFLDAYFNGDYEKAVTFCTDSLGGEIASMLSGFELLDPSIKEMVKKQASSLTTEIISVEKSENRDTIMVNYKVILPYLPTGKDKTLSFVKEEKEWKVAKLGGDI